MPVTKAQVDDRELVRRWAGGLLRVYSVRHPMVEVRRTATGDPLFAPASEPQWTLLGTDKATPYGEGLALLDPTAFLVVPGVWAYVEVRAGRPQVVEVKSEPDGPELSQTVLRKVGPIADRIRDLVVRLTVREGEVVGVTATSDAHRWDQRSFAERTADVHRETHRVTQRRGRPAQHERVAQIARAARAERRGTAAAVAEAFGISREAAKKRIKRAQAAGFETNSREGNDG